MKVKSLGLCNFRSASKVQFDFEQNLNLFVGINGSGKSTILDALSICLSWLIKRIERDNGRGSSFPEYDLRNEQNKGFLDINVSVDNNHVNNYYSWFLTKSAIGTSSSLNSRFNGASELAEYIRKSHENNNSWPVIAYYPVNRIVKNIRPDISDRDSIFNLDVYENALGGKANYQSFFEWFRIQDDILNEKAMSRSKWIQQHQRWIELRVSRLSKFLKDSSWEANREIDRSEFRHFIKRLKNDKMIYEEPRFLFRELSHMMEMVDMQSKNNLYIFDDIEYMFHKMEMFSRDTRDNLLDAEVQFEEMLSRIIRKLKHDFQHKKTNKNTISFLMETLSFACELSLWWMSDKGKRDLRKLFRLSFSIIRSENNSDETYSSIKHIIEREVQQKKNAYRNEGLDIKIVAQAIETFIPEYTHLRVQRLPKAHMLIDKAENTFSLDQLSDGEKNLIALVGDIARRLAIGNPNCSKPLEGEGIVLIDEIDLHLHPKWQSLVIPKLLDVFPNCQFFISTHSPQVISNVKPKSVFLLEQDENTLSYNKADETYGMSIERVVELIMDDEARPASVQKKFDDLFELIERNKLHEAKKLIADLKKDMKKDPELMRAEMLVRQAEM